MNERRYNPEQPRDDHGRFGSTGGESGGDAKSELTKFAKAAAITVAAMALKQYGWKLLPDWATKIAKKSLRSVDAQDLPAHSADRVDQLLAALSSEEIDRLVSALIDNMSEHEQQAIAAQLNIINPSRSLGGSPMSEIERRAYRSDKLAIEKQDGKAFRLAGHAAVFNVLSEDLGFREMIMPGAFAEAIKAGDARALFNHDPNFVLGRQSSKTLRLVEDARGLSFEVDMPDTQMVRDLVISPIERGDISQMSFGFRAARDGQKWEDQPDGSVKRSITRVSELFDISPVTFPAYTQTDVALRSLSAFRAEQAEQQKGKTPFQPSARAATAGADLSPASRRSPAGSFRAGFPRQPDERNRHERSSERAPREAGSHCDVDA
jgi:HK97 family phage prohead protease